MINYIKNSDVSIRLALNPCHWVWIPSLAYEGPTAFYPKRKTLGVAWLFLQMYVDADDGSTNLENLQKLFTMSLDTVEQKDE